MTYDTMPLEQLFRAYRRAIIHEYGTEAGDDQLRAVDIEREIVEAIGRRDSTQEWFYRMGNDKHPAVRLRGAIGLKRTDIQAAMRLLRALIMSNSWSGVPSTALREYMALERRGFKEDPAS